jgi:hypothetical protein
MRTRYGASPIHLVAHLVLLPLALWALLQVLEIRRAEYVIGWLIGAVIVHDLVLLPAYSALDRLAMRAAPGAAVNYVRVPAGFSALLALVFFPVISDHGDQAFHHVTGMHFEGYLGRWLLATAVLFAASGLIYLVRMGGSRT